MVANNKCFKERTNDPDLKLGGGGGGYNISSYNLGAGSSPL